MHRFECPLLGPLQGLLTIVFMPRFCYALAFVVAFHASQAAAIHLNVRADWPNVLAKSSTKTDTGFNLAEADDLRYYTNISLNGNQRTVYIDTGISDLWVSNWVDGSKDLGTVAQLKTPTGEVASEGPIKSAGLDFAGFTLNDQAFFEMVPSSGSIISYGGGIGLGPPSLSSIDDALGSKAVGKSVIDRIFTQNTSLPRIITVLLNRTNEIDDAASGHFTIGETLAGFERIAQQTKITLAIPPKSSKKDPTIHRWQTLLDEDGILGPDGLPIISTPSNSAKSQNGRQLTALFDTGSSLVQVSSPVASSIYSRFKDARFDDKRSLWYLPCDLEVNVTIKVAGSTFVIHPLDVLSAATVLTNGTAQPGECAGTFQPVDIIPHGPDLILGAPFLRNVYISYSYGNLISDSKSTDDPYMQLISTTNASAAHLEFVRTRLNGVDTTGAQAAQMSNKTPVSASVHSAHCFFTRNKTAVIALSSIGGAVLLMLIAGTIIAVDRWRKASREADGWRFGEIQPFFPVREPTPPKKMAHILQDDAN
ncbi:acid protease [Auriscalpium vulgare]|uniref:Acid protease n=1 Tax=Auriscalpium vulgare TaxID=40419 RepID=A0ACB8RJP4_9AGAM|nr:acid protease [Auriscalpium vulgare]